MVKIATFAKPENAVRHAIENPNNLSKWQIILKKKI
jgi:hypothetical protein